MNKQALNNIVTNETPLGLGVLVANKKNILDTYCYGKRSIEKNLDITADTIYRIASISKVIVAMCVMMLQDDGKLDINEDISKYLGYKVRNPHFPKDIITIKMLMTQSSSLCDGEDEKLGYDGVNGPRFYVSLERLLTDPTYEYYTEKTYLNKKPGTFFCYSNFGCGILACIVEKVSGMLFTNFVIERLFKPFNIDASFRATDIKNKEKIASLYRKDFSLSRDSEQFCKYVFDIYPLGDNFRGPAGGLFISMIDLSKIMRVLMNDGIYDGIRILNTDTVKEMKKVQFVMKEKNSIYQQKGLQMVVFDIFDTRLYGHTGEAYGLRSFMLFNEEKGYIFMCNGCDYKMYLNDFSRLQYEVLKVLADE